MREIDVTAEITTWDGDPMIRPGELAIQKCPKCEATFPAQPAEKPITLRWLCLNVLSQLYPDEQDLDPAVKVERYRLALRIAESDRVKLSAEDVTTIKTLIGKHWSPRVVGQVFELLDPGSVLGDQEGGAE